MPDMWLEKAVEHHTTAAERTTAHSDIAESE